MNLRQIEVFRAVMRTGSICGAAGLLHVSQPAVSQVLLHAEDQLKFALFKRVKGRLQATAEARSLYREVEDVYQGVQRINQLAESLRRRCSGSIQLLASPGPGQSLLPEALGRFCADNPDVRVTLELLGYRPMMEKLKSHQADLAVVLCPGHEEDLDTVHLCQSRLVCILPLGHPLARLRSIAPRDLRGHPLIAFLGDSAVGRTIAEIFRAAGEDLDVAVDVPFGVTAQSLVKRRVGVAVVDSMTASGSDSPDIVVRPFEPLRVLDVAFMQSRQRPSSRDTEVFIKVLRETAQSHAEYDQPMSSIGSPRSTNSSSSAVPSAHMTTAN